MCSPFRQHMIEMNRVLHRLWSTTGVRRAKPKNAAILVYYDYHVYCRCERICTPNDDPCQVAGVLCEPIRLILVQTLRIFLKSLMSINGRMGNSGVKKKRKEQEHFRMN